MEGISVYTNQVPTGFFRAPGEVQTLFAVERHMDMMADALGLEPFEFRRLNALREGDTKPTDEPVRAPRAVDVMQQVVQSSKWGQAKPRARQSHAGVVKGKGMALGFRHIGTGESNAELYLESHGSLRLATAVRDVGVGAYAMHR